MLMSILVARALPHRSSLPSEPRLRLASQTAKAYNSSLAPQPSYVLYFIEAVVSLCQNSFGHFV